MKKRTRSASPPADIPFPKVLLALQDADKPLNPKYLYRLSDLDTNEAVQLRAVWQKVPAWRRLALMEDILEIGSNNLLLSYEAVSRLALEDEDPQVRQHAVEALWEYDSRDLIEIFLNLLMQDVNPEVRAAAARALGQYVFTGELGEFPAKILRRIEDSLIQATHGDVAPVVQQAALESLGFSSREDIAGIIETVFASGDKEWMASALVAMGRSADERWQPQVLAMLDNVLPILRCEAARAAGELEIQEAVPRLIDLLADPDDNIRLASIWSLSQIGGTEARQALLKLQSTTKDEDELEFIEDALDNLAFTDGMAHMPLYDGTDLDDDQDWEEVLEEELEDEEDIFDDYQDEAK